MSTLTLRALRAPQRKVWSGKLSLGRGQRNWMISLPRVGECSLPLVPLGCGLPLGASCWLAGASGAPPPLQAHPTPTLGAKPAVHPSTCGSQEQTRILFSPQEARAWMPARTLASGHRPLKSGPTLQPFRFLI